MYRALDFYYYCISSTTDHQELDPGGGWGPLLYIAFFFFFNKEKMIHVLLLLIASSRFFVFRVKLMSDLGSHRPREESQVPLGEALMTAPCMSSGTSGNVFSQVSMCACTRKLNLHRRPETAGRAAMK